MLCCVFSQCVSDLAVVVLGRIVVKLSSALQKKNVTLDGDFVAQIYIREGCRVNILLLLPCHLPLQAVGTSKQDVGLLLRCCVSVNSNKVAR